MVLKSRTICYHPSSRDVTGNLGLEMELVDDLDQCMGEANKFWATR